MLMVIDPSGHIHCLYGEQIDLSSLGEVTIRRASFVEPDRSGWYADLSPVGGPTIGPLPLRSQALQAEYLWLEQHLATLFGQPTVDAV